MLGHFWLCKKTEEQVLVLNCCVYRRKRLLMMLAGNYGENGWVAEGRRWKKSPEVLEKGGRDITAPANAHTHTYTQSSVCVMRCCFYLYRHFEK